MKKYLRKIFLHYFCKLFCLKISILLYKNGREIPLIRDFEDLDSLKPISIPEGYLAKLRIEFLPKE